jgi:hypothetical protein
MKQDLHFKHKDCLQTKYGGQRITALDTTSLLKVKKQK